MTTEKINTNNPHIEGLMTELQELKELLYEDTERYIKQLTDRHGTREEALFALVAAHRLQERMGATQGAGE